MKILDNVRIFRPFDSEDTNEIYHIKIDNEKIHSIHKGRTDDQGSHVIDGNRNVVTTAFNDSHMHLLRYGLMRSELDLREVTSFKKMKELVHDRFIEERMEENDWVVGRGLVDSQLEDIDNPLTAKDLDELEFDKPAFFLHDDGHECVVNTKALKIIKEEPELIEGHEEFIEKDEEGNWTGRFKDTAVHFIKFNFRQKSEEEIYEAVKTAVPYLLQNGITSAHTDDLNFVGDYGTLWQTYLDLEKDGLLNIDVRLHHYIFNINDIQNFLDKDNKRTGDGTNRVKVGAFKIFLDGTQRLHTSALRQPYHDKPETKGALVYSQEELNNMVKLAHNNGMQVAMHAIGDRAVEQALTALEQVDCSELRHRIIHAQVLAPDLLERLKKVKPHLETQPGFIIDEHDQTVNWVGEEQEKYCNPWNTVDDLSIPFTASSDAPIGPLSPLTGIFAAVNRTDLDGNPDGGWIPGEKLSIDRSFEAYSLSAAKMEFREHEKGKLDEGYQADLVMLSDHPKDVAPDKLNDIKVIETWSRGERVYQQH
ncbi:amidohydrolase [Virgibacillus kekensis]|uniref:Amidohydrolase n=1 Tax=Virgibacillus kekensis TaxID=202261 RepID=A0ABV9DHI7_9BACI